ncbi:hypothetical protein TIFTF001_029940 [Ficus carica]|uniref:Uncharacterized protein n=1 Tax=Ficus carica TaxID=3494 RepID=A0AA88J478_FICCA|nr:hypothetical protein TIFTF001_029940 [Ficus carica]
MMAIVRSGGFIGANQTWGGGWRLNQWWCRIAASVDVPCMVHGPLFGGTSLALSRLSNRMLLPTVVSLVIPLL